MGREEIGFEEEHLENDLDAKQHRSEDEDEDSLQDIFDRPKKLRKVEELKQLFTQTIHTISDKNSTSSKKEIKNSLKELRKQLKKYIKKGRLYIKHPDGAQYRIKESIKMKEKEGYDSLKFRSNATGYIRLSILHSKIKFNKKNGNITLYIDKNAT